MSLLYVLWSYLVFESWINVDISKYALVPATEWLHTSLHGCPGEPPGRRQIPPG